MLFLFCEVRSIQSPARLSRLFVVSLQPGLCQDRISCSVFPAGKRPKLRSSNTGVHYPEYQCLSVISFKFIRVQSLAFTPIELKMSQWNCLRLGKKKFQIVINCSYHAAEGRIRNFFQSVLKLDPYNRSISYLSFTFCLLCPFLLVRFKQCGMTTTCIALISIRLSFSVFFSLSSLTCRSYRPSYRHTHGSHSANISYFRTKPHHTIYTAAARMCASR